MKTDRSEIADAMKRHAEDAAALLKDLANPARLLLLCQLVEGEKSVGELCDIVDLSQSSVSQHLARLREARLVETQRRGQMVYYRLCGMEVRAVLSTLYLIYCKH